LKELHKQVKLVEHADEATGIQKAIVMKTITDFNAEKQELIKRIQELEGIIRMQDKLLESNPRYRKLKKRQLNGNNN
jgi:hypothetical protein